MSLLKEFEKLSESALFSDNKQTYFAKLDARTQALFNKGDQQKLRELLSSDNKFADTVEVVMLDD